MMSSWGLRLRLVALIVVALLPMFGLLAWTLLGQQQEAFTLAPCCS